ncbi:MAG: type I-E CRISPR-associated protein Cas5/CasD [Desulfovermiculus sp.]
MPRYLTFQIYGPFAAFGSIAVGEFRGTASSPAKSAIMGLVAGALGVDRYDTYTHRELAEAYKMAVRMDAPGRVLRDFHTIQSSRPGKGVRPHTRREELESGATINTITSRRDYLNDAACMVCLKANALAPFSMEALVQALEQPVYMPYIGRKSCPLGLPLAPMLVEGKSFWDALMQRPPDKDFLKSLMQEPEEGQSLRVRIFWEEEQGPSLAHTVPRRDVPVNKKGWQFAERIELCGDMELP